MTTCHLCHFPIEKWQSMHISASGYMHVACEFGRVPRAFPSETWKYPTKADETSPKHTRPHHRSEHEEQMVQERKEKRDARYHEEQRLNRRKRKLDENE